ncbi:MAG: GDP-mannose 4,6-dehydratase [Bacteroidetes bacterium]|nr:GDP-mannose 4,6-dehydratase [Bacteroidota bacterium]
MKVLITGIGGFVGSHLAELIIKEDQEVFGLIRDPKKIENIKNVISKISLHEGELLNYNSLYSVIDKIKPDFILHTAGQPFVPTSFEKTAETFQVNVIGTINLFEAVKSSGYNPRILVITSGEVYGEAFGLPLPIEKTIPNPVNPYAASKTSIDYISQTYKKYEGLNIVIARPFNHTGIRQRENFICSSIAKQIAIIKKNNSEPILNVGNILAKRDFTDVRDMAKAYWMISKLQQNENFIFNICSGTHRSIEEVINLYEKISGLKFKLNIEQKRLRGYDIKLMAGDSSLIRSITGWSPIIKFEETLKGLLNYWEAKSN